MKWIGQHIWNFISRFRSDVYLENLSTTSEDEILVVDSDGKISKKNESTLAIDVSDFMTNGADNRVVTATGTDALNAEENLTFDGNELTIIGGGTTHPAIDIQSTNKLGSGQAAIYADINVSSSPSLNTEQRGIMIDYDKTAPATGSSSQTAKGVVVTLNDTATNEAGTTNAQWGTINTLTFDNAGGACTQYGLNNTLSGGDTQYGLYQDLSGATASTTYGIWQDVVDGGTDLMFVSSADNGDYFSIATTTNGATTITTVDDDTTAAHFVVDADGDITLDAASGNIYLKDDGGNYTPGSDYEAATKKYVDDNVGQKGWHGSTTRIKILHSDFIADDGGRPLQIDDTGSGSENFFLETFSTNPAYVTVAIPTGYTATHVMIYGSGTGQVEVWEHQINSKTGVSKGTGNVDTEIDITDVESSATNYLFIGVNAGSDEVHGGYVTIAAS